MLDGRIEPIAASSLLTLRFRVANHSRYGMALSGGNFRLLTDGQSLAPTTAPNVALEAETTTDADVVFEVPRDAKTVMLRIAHDRETAEVPVDLEGRTGPTAARDREARRAGRSNIDVAIDRVRGRTRSCKPAR
jgi:hypothetical protein